MHRTFVPLALTALLGLAGSAVAQEAPQTGQAPNAESAGQTEGMTCADLNEMESAEAAAFLRGYQYAQDAAGRAGGSNQAAAGGETSTAAATSTETSTGTAASTETGNSAEGSAAVGVAATTGDPSSGTPDETGAMDIGAKAILDSCFDAPSTSLDEALSGTFGTTN